MKTKVKITFLMLWAMFMPLIMKAGVEVPPNGTDANLYGHVRNGGGYEVELDENLWKNGRKQLRVNSAIMEG